MKNISLLKAKKYKKNLPGAQMLSLLGPISAIDFRNRRRASTVVVVVVDVVGQMASSCLQNSTKFVSISIFERSADLSGKGFRALNLLRTRPVLYGLGECLICSISAAAYFINRPNLI